MSIGAGLSWFGFWLFLAVVVASDAWLYSQGHEGLLFTHKTEAEKAIRDRQAGLREGHRDD